MAFCARSLFSCDGILHIPRGMVAKVTSPLDTEESAVVNVELNDSSFRKIIG